LEQARDYLGTEIEKDKGFEGEIYLAKDKSEMRFHVTRCATVKLGLANRKAMLLT
jgi:hypothetical protein